MSAASYSSRGMLCRAPSAITIMNGNPSQTFVMITAQNASNGCFSHCTPGRPNHCVRIRLMAPYS